MPTPRKHRPWRSGFFPPRTRSEAVLQWTVDRDAADVRRLLTWLPDARSSRERDVLMMRVRGLLDELTEALDALEAMR